MHLDLVLVSKTAAKVNFGALQIYSFSRGAALCLLERMETRALVPQFAFVLTVKAV